MVKMKAITLILSFAVLFSSTIFAQSGWFPVYGDTNAAWQWNFFTDVNSGYSVGYKFMGLAFPRVIKTTNAGSTWFEQTTPERDSGNFYYRCVFFTDINTGFIVAANATGSDIGRILKTTNGGNTWNIVVLPVNKHMASIFFVNSNTGYASGYQTILKTTDAGATWIPKITTFSYYLFAIHFTDVNTGYVAGNLGTILKTTNGGDNWVLLNSGTNQSLWGLHFADASTGVAVGGASNNTANLILRTTDAGNNWAAVTYTYSTCLLWSVRFISPTTGYIIGWCSQVLKTTNGGLNWYNQAVPESNYWGRTCFFTSTNTGYLAGEYDLPGTQGYIYKTTDGGGQFVGVNPVKNEVPAQFHLYQNYPNPFNPSTKIKFNIPLLRGVSARLSNEQEGRGVFVTLKIYDALGREVTSLINERLNPGTYEIDWVAGNYPSGVYYYKLVAEDYSETKKMILIK
jgi:photosystem II stability/assembly factor-like uncharacterized protein